ncbi:unnamed protein product [Vitrella brassicaformis CCMP3155]|uniref:Uncharacterized protein n=1 Tax=Vitrella brassicaformis (strain CCMP3155) TaxID=1169540 RepID=A0A0G4GAD5_VITBC|nr:unnamed protein product [Vitrella brassicaformis CCMP3155]|eukprot:CEM25938.1 unnamed protein product [Vitrella brassicaformis CCMP3155]
MTSDDTKRQGPPPSSPSVTDDGHEDGIASQLAAARQQAAVIIEQADRIEKEISERVTALGGTADVTQLPADRMDDKLDINVSGERLRRVKRSALCAVKGTVMATLFDGRFDKAFVRDSENRIFLPVYPPVFRMLVERLHYYERWGEIAAITLPVSKKADRAYSFWFGRLMHNPSTRRAKAGGAGDGGVMDDIDDDSGDGVVDMGKNLLATLERLSREKAVEMARLDAIKPMLKTGDVEDDQLLSIDEEFGGRVTMTQAAAKSLGGDDSTFYARFTKYDPLSQCGLDDVRRVVDIVVRAHQQWRDMTAADVLQAMGDTPLSLFRWALDVFGLEAERFFGPADGLLTAQHLQNIKAWGADCNDFPNIPSYVSEPVERLYKATVDGWRFGDLVKAVKAHELLLPILRVKGTSELFGTVIKGKIDLTGPKKKMQCGLAYDFKLTGTDAHSHVGCIGDDERIYHLAGLQEKLHVTDLTNIRAPDLLYVLGTGNFDIGITAPDEEVPAAAADVSLKRCQASVHKSDDRWADWEREESNGYLPVSELGLHFELDEIEAYKLA